LIKNKTILVAGANGLLGQALVKSILNHGGRVVALDIGPFSSSETQNGLIYKQLDINNPEHLKTLFNDPIKIDGAVNCAYPRNSNFGKPFFEVQLEDFNENISLNIGSTFLFSKTCAKYFNENKTPFSLVNIGSIYGVKSPNFEIYNNTKMTMPIEYSAIKSSILHLNKYIAAFINDSNFRINAVSPGGIEDGQDIRFKDEYKRHTFGRGLLAPQDVCGAIVFLLSDYSNFINGQNIVVDDGFTI